MNMRAGQFGVCIMISNHTELTKVKPHSIHPTGNMGSRRAAHRASTTADSPSPILGLATSHRPAAFIPTTSPARIALRRHLPRRVALPHLPEDLERRTQRADHEPQDGFPETGAAVPDRGPVREIDPDPRRRGVEAAQAHRGPGVLGEEQSVGV